MKSTRSQLVEWVDQGVIRPEAIEQAFAIAGVTPDAARWQRFVSALLLWLGALLFAAGVIFFFAYNWDALGRFSQFGLVEVLLAAAVGIAWYAGLDSLAGKASLTFAALLTGALLALIGQTYQTGADPYELFLIWAVLILPWAFVARLPVLWLLVLALLNLTTILYVRAFHGIFGVFFDEGTLMWALMLLNTAALVAWELAAFMGIRWLNERWATRIVAAASGTMITTLTVWAIFDTSSVNRIAFVVYAFWLVGAYLFYRYCVRDLFVLAGGVLSVIVVVVSLMSEHMIGTGDPGALLLIGLVVIAMSAGGAMWLRTIAAEGGTE